MEKKIKLDDVARLAGVSKATASRVLNHRGYLSQKTIDKVHQAMEDLNYRPNAIARQLYKNKPRHVRLTNAAGLLNLPAAEVGSRFF